MHTQNSSLLYDTLAQALPNDAHFIIHHVSTPPTVCAAIYSAPPGKKPERTYCETQFLSISVPSDDAQIQVFGLEVLIYTTKYLTTVFVSKADSSGYLHLLKLPKGTPSPLKTISSTFLKYLVDQRQRPGKRLVLSLFARAQNQYLFPGSVENSRKHVLDDRKLIKWWCQVVDKVLEPCAPSPPVNETSGITNPETDDAAVPVHGFLRIPGCDKYETATFFPKHTQNILGSTQQRWNAADPLRDLGRGPNLPERCLIPRFPDDPKSRFLIDLDDELPDPDNELQGEQLRAEDNDGRWRSVRSLEQFWDMMSFRQECSAGRLVGFIWGVFRPQGLDNSMDTLSASPSPSSSPSKPFTEPALPTPLPSQPRDSQSLQSETPFLSSPVRDVQAPLSPSTPIRSAMKGTQASTASPSITESPQKPMTSTQASPRKAIPISELPKETKYYYWPASGRGEIVIREKAYQRINKFLLKMDYTNEEIAKKSTEKWLGEVAAVAGKHSWGQSVVGQNQAILEAPVDAPPTAATLNMGLVKRKKKRPIDDGNGAAAAEQLYNENGANKDNDGPNVLDAGLMRKKARIETDQVT